MYVVPEVMNTTLVAISHLYRHDSRAVPVEAFRDFYKTASIRWEVGYISNDEVDLFARGVVNDSADQEAPLKKRCWTVST